MNTSLRWALLPAVLLLPLTCLGACGGGGAGASNDASLATLTISTGVLTPVFAPDVTTYNVGPRS